MVSSPIKIPFLSSLGITFIITDGFNEGKFNEDVDEAISNGLSLTNLDRYKITKYIIKNYDNIVNSVGEEPLPLECDNEIWKYVYPKEIYVSRRPYKDKKIYIQIMCECDWEEEHGLQIIFREGLSLNRVSQQDGHLTYSDAYGLPDSQDSII